MTLDNQKDPKNMSVEEILKSIRNIIDDRNGITAKKQNKVDIYDTDAQDQDINVNEEEEILELTNVVDNYDTTPRNTVSGGVDANSLYDNFITSSTTSSDSLYSINKNPTENHNDDKLLSDDLLEKTTHSLSNFVKNAQNITTTNQKQVTLEELVQPILRAELRNWLNKNLPEIVEKLLEKEIQKLVNTVNPKKS